MATLTEVKLIDDIDGTDATQTITFGLDGIEYAIDLNDSNAAKLRKILTEHASVARRAGGRKVRGTGSSVTKNTDAGKMREWIRAQGGSIADRGRIPAHWVTQYQASLIEAQKPAQTQEKAPEDKPKTTTRKTATRKPAAAKATNVVEFKAADTTAKAKRTPTTRTRKTSTPK